MEDMEMEVTIPADGIKVAIPTDEEIAHLKELGIDVESHLVRVFAEELHRRLHPDEEKVMN